MKKLVAILAATTAAAAVPATAHAAIGTGSGCTTIHDRITKTDTGHGSPAAWADLVLRRTTRVCGNAETGYTVRLVDDGALWTRPGAGTPNGTGGTIAHRVRGHVHGTYALTVTGGKLAHRHGDVTASSTAYVQSLFSEGATVTGGDYAWAYTTVCREKWLDSSANNDGQGAAAGNITGTRCHRAPSPTPTGTPSPTPTSTTPSAPGEAPAPSPVRTDLPVTG